jgi:hypothetical protein
VDSLSQYNDSLSLNYQFLYHYDKTVKRNICFIGPKRLNGLGSELYWSWNLINNKKTFKVYTSYLYNFDHSSSGIGPIGTDKLPEWEIIKLKYDDIKMKTNYNGKEYCIELESSKS